MSRARLTEEQAREQLALAEYALDRMKRRYMNRLFPREHLEDAKSRVYACRLRLASASSV